MRNPGLMDPMMLHHLIKQSDDSGMCIHCNENKPEEGLRLERMDMLSIDVCEACANDIFENEKLPQPYKYCPTCHDFHFISFFINERNNSLSRSCVNSTVECASRIKVFASPHSIAEWKYREEEKTSDSLTSLLRKEGCLNPSLSCCSHCGCFYTASCDCAKQLCARCRSEYVFRCGASLWYKWCGACECFHRLAAFYDAETRRFDVVCSRRKDATPLYREVEEASLPREEARVLEMVQKHYPASRLAVTEEVREVLNGMRRVEGQCLLCGRVVENGGCGGRESA